MPIRSKGVVVFSFWVVLSMLFSACTPQTVPTPEKIIETVVVEVAGTPVVQEKVVTVTPAAEGPLMADGMVDCKPLPELPSGVSLNTTSGPNIVSDVPKRILLSEPKPRVVLHSDKVYRVGVLEDVTTLNFWGANGPDDSVYNSYMLPQRLSLYTLSDKYFTFIPQLAKDFPTALQQEGDFWVVEIPIREDVKWSNGVPLKAKDFAFTANTALKFGLISGNWSTWYDANFLDHIEAKNDYTVKIFYHTKPGLARHEWGTLQAPILAAHYWEPKVAEAGASIDALAADVTAEQKAAAQAEAQDRLFAISPDNEPLAGGFLLVKWEQGAFLEVSANHNYFQRGEVIKQWANGAYRDSSGLKVGTPEGDVETTIEVGPNVESIVYTVYGSQDAAILALKNGEIDFILSLGGLQRGLAEQLRNDPNLTVTENHTNGFRYLSFNVRRRPMNDCSFRQAVAVLIDKEFITKSILQDVVFPLYAFVSEGNKAWFYRDAPQLGKALSREQRTNLALDILKQAGYTWEGGIEPKWDDDNRQVVAGGRLIMPDGTPVPSLKILAPSPDYDPLRSTFAIWIETWLNEFGISVQADLVGFNVLVSRFLTEQNFDMYIFGWLIYGRGMDMFPSYLSDFFSEEQAVQDGNNAGGYISPKFEELSANMLTCETVEACKKIADEIQNLLAIECPYVMLFDTGIIEAYSNVVEFPYTEQFSGLQYTHQAGSLQTTVKIK